jgi:hypothetical protein
MCNPNTRTIVLTDLQLWADWLESAKLYWMNGMAGTGKTTIAFSFCSRLQRASQLGASFFCSRLFAECRDVSRIVPTIAYQLARFSLPFQSALCDVLGKDPDIGDYELSDQFEKLIREPLTEAKEAIPGNVVVVIDALDECSDNNGARAILDLLFRYAADLPVKFFVTSRPEPIINDRMQAQNPSSRSICVLHDIEKSIVQADIETYLSSELGSMDPPPSGDQIRQLAAKAGNLFIYAATALLYICPENTAVDSQERLTAMLQITPTPYTTRYNKINDLYGTILAEALENPSLEPTEVLNIRTVLHTVVCLMEPLSIKALASLLGLGDERKVRVALKRLQSVINVSESSALVSTLHASFPDYMLSAERSGRFLCDLAAHGMYLSQRCLDTMAKSLCFNICDLKSSFEFDEDVPDLRDRVDNAVSPQLFYACRYWGHHLERAGTSDALRSCVEGFLAHRLLFWMEVLNLSKCISAGGPILSQAHTWLRVSGCQQRV